jgi:hypothetical protein
MMGKERGVRLVLELMAIAALAPPAVHAGCNTIPEPPVAFRGARGTINRAFVQAGDEVRITLGSADGIPEIKDTSGLHVTVGIRGAAIARASVPDVRLLQAFPAPPVVAFTFPDTGAYGPAIITVGDGAAANVTACNDAAVAGLLACIDTLAPPTDIEVTTCSGKLEVIALPPSNDFRALCTGGDALPKCTPTANELRFAIDGDGSAYIPVHWAKSLPAPAPGPNPFPRRSVSGSSAVPAFPNQLAHIVVPNADYLKALTLAGTDFPKKPKFEPDITPTPGNRFALALTGETDKGDSLLRICRRIPTGFECAAGPTKGESCDPTTGAANCPNACSPVYSFCSPFAAKRAGEPCTDPADCGGSACEAGNTCRRPDRDTYKPCRREADCAAGEECGPGLFEFRYDGRAVGKMVTIPRAADSTWRGVCDAGPYVNITCSRNDECDPFQTGNPALRCVAFRAAAGKYK